jgi:hypothetical protein
MKEQIFCYFCKEELKALNFDAWKCEYCNQIFCSHHKFWKYHNCKSVPESEIKKEQMKYENPSKVWYLLPIFLGWIGGVIGYFELKDRNRKRAKTILFIGIGLWGLYLLLAFSTFL